MGVPDQASEEDRRRHQYANQNANFSHVICLINWSRGPKDAGGSNEPQPAKSRASKKADAVFKISPS